MAYRLAQGHEDPKARGQMHGTLVLGTGKERVCAAEDVIEDL